MQLSYLLVLASSNVIIICARSKKMSVGDHAHTRRVASHARSCPQNPPVKLKSPLLPFLACFLSHFSLSSIEYSHARLRSRSSPVSLASCFSPIASACLRFRSSLAKLRAESRIVFFSVIKSCRFALAESACFVEDYRSRGWEERGGEVRTRGGASQRLVQDVANSTPRARVQLTIRARSAFIFASRSSCVLAEEDEATALDALSSLSSGAVASSTGAGGDGADCSSTCMGSSGAGELSVVVAGSDAVAVSLTSSSACCTCCFFFGGAVRFAAAFLGGMVSEQVWFECGSSVVRVYGERERERWERRWRLGGGQGK